MMRNGDPKRERPGGDTAAPGWYPDPAAPGGHGWWTGHEWGWPFSRPTGQLAPRPSRLTPPPARLTTARARWLARHGWLLWRALTCVSALGCAAACAILGAGLVTGRPLYGAASGLSLTQALVLELVAGFNGLALLGASVALRARASALRSAWALREAEPPLARPGRRAGLRAFRLTWASCLSSLVVVSALVGWVTHAALGWWAQTLIAIFLANQFAFLCAVAFYLSRARPAPGQLEG
jgi:hypothetical protein